LTIESQGKALAKGSLFASRYRIDGELGRGGMGVVFKAEDTKLRRTVALKFLPTEFGIHPEAKERFLREARAAAALDHPHICTIYEADEAEGMAYIAMAYVEGRTLASRIAQGPLPIDEALDLAGQLADGLAEAHRKGILHRDIKSSNIMLTGKGQAKIMDFGLAKVAGDTSLTKEARTMGTISYMSPEQARGEELDRRTDIWSLGVVIYEMLSGRLPFLSGHEQAVIYGILHEEPPPLRTLRNDIPEAFANVVSGALAKKRDNRYPTAEDLLADLKRVKDGLTVAAPRTGVLHGRKKVALAGTGLLVVISATVLLLTLKGSAKVYDTIAVMPFVMSGSGPGQEDISDALTEEVIKKLYQVAALKVKAFGAVLPYKSSPKSPREIGKKLGVKALVMSRMSRPAGGLRIAVDLVDAATETVLWTESYEKDMEDVLVLQSALTQDIVRNVRVRLTPDEQARLSKSQKVSPEAYERYLKALDAFKGYSYSRARYDRVLALIDEAIALDPNYARFYVLKMAPYWGLWAQSFISYSEMLKPINDAINNIIQIDPDSADAYKARAQQYFFTYRWKDYLRALEKSVELSPGDEAFRPEYIDALGALGYPERALEEYRLMLAKDPSQDENRARLAMIYLYAHRYDDALVIYLEQLKKDPESVGDWWNAGLAYSLKRMRPEAMSAYEKSIELMQREGVPVPIMHKLNRGNFLARVGKREEALAIFAEIERSPERAAMGTLFDFYVAGGLASTGNPNDREEAFRYLERSVAEPHPASYTIEIEPDLDPLRSDPRFAQIVKKVGFPFK
jgi:serine/threonine protein kinase/tetratricopeptide (TPR) repeat protein